MAQPQSTAILKPIPIAQNVDCIDKTMGKREQIPIDSSIAVHFTNMPTEIQSTDRELLKIMCDYYQLILNASSSDIAPTNLANDVSAQKQFLKKHEGSMGKLLLLSDQFGALELRKTCLELLHHAFCSLTMDELKKHWCSGATTPSSSIEIMENGEEMNDLFSREEEEVIVQQNILMENPTAF
jgi:hypothetical protein